MPTLEQFRALYLDKLDAFNRRDWEAVLDGLPPQFEWHFLEDTIDRHPVGPSELAAAFDDLLAQFPDWQVEPLEIVEPVPGSFVARLVAWGAGAASGAPIRLDFAQVWDFEGDQAVRCREFSDFTEALTKARQ